MVRTTECLWRATLEPCVFRARAFLGSSGAEHRHAAPLKKKPASAKRKAPYFLRSTVLFLVEITGIEPVTSCMPCKRSPEPRTHTPPHKGARTNDIQRRFVLFTKSRISASESKPQYADNFKSSIYEMVLYSQICYCQEVWCHSCC